MAAMLFYLQFYWSFNLYYIG